MQQYNRLPISYAYVAYFFILSVCATLLYLFLFTFGQAEIIISPNYEDVKTSMIITIQEKAFQPQIEENDSIDGKVYEYISEDSLILPTTGSKDVISDVIGKVSIVNNSNQIQTLIAKTRLLSKDGTLVRMKDRVKIPVGQTFEVSVYPDNPEEFLELPPTSFTIPGLPKSLWDKVYGISTTQLKAGGYKVKVVNENDIIMAENKLKDSIAQKVISDFNEQLGEDQNFYSRLVEKVVLDKYVDGSVGEEKEQLNVNMKLRIIILAFDEVKLLNKVKKNMLEGLPAGKTLKEFNTNNIQYVVEKYDLFNKQAFLRVDTEGKSVIRGESYILDKKLFAGLSKEATLEKLSSYPEIKKVKINFYPSWLHKIPRNHDKIDILVE